MTNYDIVLDAVLGCKDDADEFFRIYQEFDPDGEYDPMDMALALYDALDWFTWAKYEVSDYDGDDYP